MEMPKEVEELLVKNVPDPTQATSENPFVKWLKELAAEIDE